MLGLAPLLLSLPLLASAWERSYHAQNQHDFNGWDYVLGKSHHYMPGRQYNSSIPTLGNSTFSQLIDHANPSLGSFEQFYYYSTEFWEGPGSPVIMFTPGEINVTGYQSYASVNRTTGVLAQELGAAVFVVEHRYWGTSSPYADLTTANLQYLTLENSIEDLVYFAQKIKLPWAPHVPSTAKDVPWVMSGGSYSGALSAWTESVAPGTYWAYHSSSAPVQAISDYWAYFLPVQEGMPKNCSKDVGLVIDHLDDILTNGSEEEVTELKKLFLMEDVEHNDDFMGALENGPWLWQGNQFYTGYSPFFQWCDFIEGVLLGSNSTNSTTPSAKGVGLDKALQGYATWFTTELLPGLCESYGYPEFNGTYNTACFDTYDPSSPLFTDTSLSNEVDRQWFWMLCNEPFGYWQDGAPKDRPTIVSRLVTAEYQARQCALYFPTGPNGETYALAKGKTEADTNAYTGGWDDRTSHRLIYATGGFDPWRETGVSAELRPGGPLQSTAQTPVNVVPGGFHTSDLITKNGVANAGCKAVIDKEVAQIKSWVAEWPGYARKGGHHWSA
ncbi:serine carboxypeptidase [Polychaeton citri CBS 116435]|uniref:Serine carboxypeptidase n=1 Tax=Polychaeton citri CBS 116435 TaxID=1314669 RepID=A0A9P4Q1U8_9PEZI|nr:serine carboxypeptidase [Polychaeton citri CBS 116435]